MVFSLKIFVDQGGVCTTQTGGGKRTPFKCSRVGGTSWPAKFRLDTGPRDVTHARSTDWAFQAPRFVRCLFVRNPIFVVATIFWFNATGINARRFPRYVLQITTGACFALRTWECILGLEPIGGAFDTLACSIVVWKFPKSVDIFVLKNKKLESLIFRQIRQEFVKNRVISIYI